ncbi:MAG: peptide chain release factor N(5)-glutamine methyltransferase, partial [Rickettsiella sp.]|nr:peptide chain release factor N(5)-glutamine methyltransferase [Rickettsiella sp.]
MLLQSLWRWSVNELIPTSTTPHLDAELLLAAALGLTRAQLYSQSPSTVLSITQQQSVESSINRRKTGEPIAYLLAQQEFWSLLLDVNPAVLVPRPETELLVQLLLQNNTNNERKIADLGTGSGAIALALASERPSWQIVATDYSHDALQVAEKNRSRYDLKNVELRQGDWCGAFLKGEYFDMIVSNPPYLVNNDPHFQTELGLAFEPKMALFAGENGLCHIETIIRTSRHHLLMGGTLFLEHGYEQAALVSRLFLEWGYHTLQHHKDLAGQQRVMSGKW